MADPIFRQFRIRGAQVVSLSPLVVRQRASADVRLQIDDEEALSLEPGQILLWVASAPGTVNVDGPLPELGVDLGPEVIELVFGGAVEARVEGEELVIDCTCNVKLAAGEGFVPFDPAQVEGASLYRIETDDAPTPHQPKRQP